MRKIARDKKIQANSLSEIRRGVRDEAERLADLGMKGEGRAARPAHILNWWVCYMLSLPAQERTRIARAGQQTLDRLTSSDQPIPFDMIFNGDPVLSSAPPSTAQEHQSEGSYTAESSPASPPISKRRRVQS